MPIQRVQVLIAAFAAGLSLSFTPAPSLPSVAADTTWEAVAGTPQDPQRPMKPLKNARATATGQGTADDATTKPKAGIDDLNMTYWPGFRGINALGSLFQSPLRSPGSGGMARNRGPNRPPLPQSPISPKPRVLPPTPSQPISPFLP